MINNLKKLVVVGGFCSLATSSFAGTIDYKNYCKNGMARETKIIINLNNLDNVFYGQIIKELLYTPHEYVEIIAYKPKEKTLTTLYSFCNTLLTDQEISKENKKGIFDKAFGSKISQMQEDTLFLKTKITQNLAKLQKHIVVTDNKDSNFQDALENFLEDAKAHTRVVLFNSEPLTLGGESLDFNMANIEMYAKAIPTKKVKEGYRNYFISQKANFEYKNRVSNEKQKTLDLIKYEVPFNIYIQERPIKSKIDMIINPQNGEIESGWLISNGIMIAPVAGAVTFNTARIKTLKIRINEEVHYKQNIAYKNDMIDLSYVGNKYLGKYYNHAFVFDMNTDKYFEYEIK